MPDTAKIDLRIKHLTTIEADYRTEVKRAMAASKADPGRKAKYARTIAKFERKLERINRKVRRLREVRSAMRARSA